MTMAGRSDDLYSLPADLPVPVNDGACAHLTGARIPAVELPSTAGRLVNLAALSSPAVVYCYPRTGEPDKEPLTGWDEIPGARGCTPETCGFRDHYGEFAALGALVVGLSTQSTEYQLEMVRRLRVPFEVLSDSDLLLTRALRLPTFDIDGLTLIRRLTMFVRHGTIEKVYYPIFPPDRHAVDLLADLQAHLPSGR
jgi:peroxiredoxin